MIVLHAGLDQGRLLFWSEATAEDAGGRRLAQALWEKRAKVPVKDAVAWLPAVNGEPVPSTPVLGEAPKGKPVLMPVAVEALEPPPEIWIALLAKCAGKQILQPGLLVGPDIAYWAAALRLAGALLARQQYLPGIVEADGGFGARWEPLITGPDLERFRKLAAAMPPAARAISSDPGQPPQRPAAALLRDFLALAVDWGARRAGERKWAAGHRATVHDQWLAALLSPDSRIDGDAGQLRAFAAQVRQWQRPVTMSAAAPHRLCFRLEDPEDGDGAWRVRYLLQSNTDPSLLIPASEAGPQTRELLLSSLGQAAALCPRIEASLKDARPSGYEADAAGAHEFLTGRAAVLEMAGFGVLLPAWWSRKGTKVRLAAKARVKSSKLSGGGGLTMSDVVHVDWEIALGDEKLTQRELMELARQKSPLVQVRGQWVQLSAEEIRAALDFWKRKGSGQATVRDVIRMALGVEQGKAEIEVGGVEATGWVGDLLRQLEGNAAWEELRTPEPFQGELRPYQARGFSWLAFLRRWGLGACLADDMGLGKTIQTLALIQHDREAGIDRPVLLICPTSVVGNWKKEAARFTPELPVMVHHGVARAKGAQFQREAGEHAIVISSYALLQRDIEILQGAEWAGIILDEAQNIKNPETKQSRAARGLKADYRIALTGTPVENNVGDLWSIMEFLNPGLLGSQMEFRKRFFIPIQAYRDAGAAERLKRATGPFVLRRLKTDRSIISDLPDKMEMKVYCRLTREQASLYAAVVKDAEQAIEASDGISRRGLILAALSKLKQVCNHPAQFLQDNSAPSAARSGKLARLTEMLEEILAVGESSLVFSQFAEMGALLQKHLEATFGEEVLFLHGALAKKRRDEMVERFQEENGPRIFLLSLKAGGTGLNLTRASHVFHFDRWWNPAVENQATDRAFRIGQRRNVQVHKFLCAGTLEERIDEMIERKQEIAGAVVGAGEGWLTELSNKEIKDLFRLSKEAVED